MPKENFPPLLYQAEKYRGALWREAARKRAGLCRMYFLVRMQECTTVLSVPLTVETNTTLRGTRTFRENPVAKNARGTDQCPLRMGWDIIMHYLPKLPAALLPIPNGHCSLDRLDHAGRVLRCNTIAEDQANIINNFRHMYLLYYLSMHSQR